MSIQGHAFGHQGPGGPLLPSIASVAIQMGIKRTWYDGKLIRLASASGFVVETTYKRKFLVTNRHNVTGLNNDTNQPMGDPTYWFAPTHIAIQAPLKDKTNERFSSGAAGEAYAYPIIPLYDKGGNPVWFEHENKLVDVVAILLTDHADNEAHPWLFDAYPRETWSKQQMMSPPEPVIQAGDPLHVVGYPLGFAAHVGLPIWTQAHAASDSAIAPGFIEQILIDANTMTGNSGSAVVLYENKGTLWMGQRSKRPFQVTVTEPITQLIGIYSGRLTDTNTQKATTIGRVWKRDVLDDIIPYATLGFRRASFERPTTNEVGTEDGHELLETEIGEIAPEVDLKK